DLRSRVAKLQGIALLTSDVDLDSMLETLAGRHRELNLSMGPILNGGAGQWGAIDADGLGIAEFLASEVHSGQGHHRPAFGPDFRRSQRRELGNSVIVRQGIAGLRRHDQSHRIPKSHTWRRMKTTLVC